MLSAGLDTPIKPRIQEQGGGYKTPSISDLSI